ncbi:uncharacterized protein EAE97_003175 [Botrytis byssoidea]|uniref:Methyltransferase type 11 domain-containing protein n=1 Tax=Botrytis byssoidea TaxID=139641 RepID=A0A9P5IS97_9HELO|nr:uncharacterized protein EAE97_003175 [Botrytis byssoidea]KAF7949666.1 hypothetical protein EAE97_003175 [Botrytis byssoidea]
MSAANLDPTDPPNSDPTFRNYTSQQAAKYAAHRLSYPAQLYETVIQHHEKTGGQFNLVLDLGCGPGNATRDIAAYFEEAIGCDAGEAMIGAARKLGGKTKSGKDIVLVVGSGEEFLGLEEVKEGTVDLITVAMAVHWFDMDKFWAQVAKALKPGGTVALWTRGSTLSSYYPHPSVPNRSELLRIFLNFERHILAPYELLPNRLSRDMYDNLPLPWDIPHPIPSSILPPSQFLKLDYDRDGILSNPESDDFFFGGREVTLKQAEKSLETASMVTRWREAHPEAVGTEKDVLRMHMEELRKAMGENESMRTGSSTTIILVKKALQT